jgi:hypothetical protein
VRSLIARLAALEGQQPSTEPFAVQVEVARDGTTVSVCYPLPNAHTDRMTLRAYRARFGDRYRHRERWVILGDAEPVEDRMSERW